MVRMELERRGRCGEDGAIWREEGGMVKMKLERIAEKGLMRHVKLQGFLFREMEKGAVHWCWHTGGSVSLLLNHRLVAM